MNKKFQLPDFVEIQRTSFLSFLKKGLCDEFAERSHFKTKGFEIIFEPSSIRFHKPYSTTFEAVSKKQTYVSQVSICATFIYQGENVPKLSLISSINVDSKFSVHVKSNRKDFRNSDTLKQRPLKSSLSYPSEGSSARTTVSPTIHSEEGLDFEVGEGEGEGEGKIVEPTPTPTRSDQGADEGSRTSSSPQGRSQLSLKKKKITKLKIRRRLYLFELPLMTSQGHFIINGSPRVLVSQLIRCPGVYFSKQKQTYRVVESWYRYHTSFISEKGAWLRFESDRLQRIWVRINRFKKIPLILFLKAIGFDNHELQLILPENYYEALLKHTAAFKICELFPTDFDEEEEIYTGVGREDLNIFQALQEFNFRLFPVRIEKVSRARKFIEKKFFDPEFYDLGRLGRLKINQKFKYRQDLKTRTLTAEDILMATHFFLTLIFKQEGELDDVDDLKNRRVRPAGELIRDQVRVGLKNFETRFSIEIGKTTEGAWGSGGGPLRASGSGKPPRRGRGRIALSAEEKVKHLHRKYERTIRRLFLSHVQKDLHKFFGTNPLSQYLDQTNPLAELTHKRRLTCLGPGGLKREQTSLLIREIHPSHYGRLCPIETPEGMNAGLVNSLTTVSKMNRKGFLITPFYKVLEGQVQINHGLRFLSSGEEEKLMVSPGDLLLSNTNTIVKTSVPSRSLQEFQTSPRDLVDFIGISPNQILSVATSLIPFLEHDDANRALMASNMQRQSVPLLRIESPIVGTGFESKAAKDSRRPIVAKEMGKVLFVGSKKILLQNIVSRGEARREPPKGGFGLEGFAEPPKAGGLAEAQEGVRQSPRTGKAPPPGSRSERSGSLKILSYKKRKKNKGSKVKVKKGKVGALFKSRPTSGARPSESTGGGFGLEGFAEALQPLTPKTHKKTTFKKDSEPFNKKENLFLRKCFTLNVVPKALAGGSGSSGSSVRGARRSPPPAEQTRAPSKGAGGSASSKPSRGGFAGSGWRASPKPSHGPKGVFEELWTSNKSSTYVYKKYPKKKRVSSYSLKNYERSNQDTVIHNRPLVTKNELVMPGSLLADSSSTKNGETALGKNLLVAYMPWNGFNFEDAIIMSERVIHLGFYKHLHFEKYDIVAQKTARYEEIIGKEFLNEKQIRSNLNDLGIIECGSWVESGDVLVGKYRMVNQKSLSPYLKLLYAIFEQDDKKKRGRNYKNKKRAKDSSFRVPSGVYGRIIGVSWKYDNENIQSVRIFIAYMKNIQLGDKMSGRHGNKGILSKIAPRQDMPFLQDGTSVDMILSPLGVPSRMNVGQLLECLLGFAGKNLKQSYRLAPFDEKYGVEASRGFVYKKLYEMSKKINKQWLFDPNFPGKSYLFDGCTGESFHQTSTVGYSYMLKLIHLVDKKIHARSTGPYSLVTQQPLRGRANNGGQRLGEMEVWAFEGFGASYALQEVLSLKSDDMLGRRVTYSNLVLGKEVPNEGNLPESSKVMLNELRALCVDVQLLNENFGKWMSTPSY